MRQNSAAKAFSFFAPRRESASDAGIELVSLGSVDQSLSHRTTKAGKIVLAVIQIDTEQRHWLKYLSRPISETTAGQHRHYDARKQAHKATHVVNWLYTL